MERLPAPAMVPDEFLRRFVHRIEERNILPLADFVDLALYDPQVGYYRAKRPRVGREPGTDFYTASSLSLVFGPLLAAATRTLIGEAKAGDHPFVEIGAEPESAGVLAGISHGFAATRVVRVDDAWELPARAVVFSNELFDAQPFHRIVFRGGMWREIGVRLQERNFVWQELPALSPEVAALAPRLPVEATDGYTIDLPLRAASLLARLADMNWKGLFVACDYGRTWEQLTTQFPAGTGRAYHAHRQGGDLLANPGTQDLTCHVCWDWLEDALRTAGFRDVTRESQEAFFVHHAAPAIAALMAGDRDPLSRVRTQLKHLLHPALLGQRFEVLWARRP